MRYYSGRPVYAVDIADIPAPPNFRIATANDADSMNGWKAENLIRQIWPAQCEVTLFFRSLVYSSYDKTDRNAETAARG